MFPHLLLGLLCRLKYTHKAETPVLWPPQVKSWLIGKDSDAGRDWGQEEKGTEDEMAGWHHQLNGHELDVSLSELRELVMDREAWRAVIHGCAQNGTRLSDWTELNADFGYLPLSSVSHRYIHLTYWNVNEPYINRCSYMYTSMCVCVCVCVCMLVTQLCLTLCDPMNCSPPGFSVHGILQARILEWIAIPLSVHIYRKHKFWLNESYSFADPWGCDVCWTDHFRQIIWCSMSSLVRWSVCHRRKQRDCKPNIHRSYYEWS